MSPDQRVKLSQELTPAAAAPALEALDRTRLVIRADPRAADPANALGAAALLVLAARTHAHVELDDDLGLPRNPWGADSLQQLHGTLSGLRPEPATSPSATLVVDVGGHPAGSAVRAGLRIGGDAWTAQTTQGGDIWRTPPAQSDAPYGMLIAAGFAAGHLFREALRPLGLPAHPAGAEMTWNILTHRRMPAPAWSSNARAARRWPQVAWLGCGSVNSSAIAALACGHLEGLTTWTIDQDHLDPGHNPFRYPACTGAESGEKSEWASTMLARSGADSTGYSGPVRDWVRTRPAAGFHGIAVCAVDTIDGRYEAADLLAQTTLSAAVSGMALHIQREHLGDEYRCPYCDFVDQRTPLSQAAADAALTGLAEQRIIELLNDPLGLTQADVDQLVALGKFPADAAPALLGRRVADLRARVYADGLVPAPSPEAPPTPVSAPFVSWITGVLCAAEIAKASQGLPLVNRRVELDLHGLPDDFTHKWARDRSGRCACASIVRRRWMQKLYH
jgi:hypothetical protein